MKYIATLLLGVGVLNLAACSDTGGDEAGPDPSNVAATQTPATTAETDALMHAEILSWSRSRGVFAGIALKGATLRADADANKELYGKVLETRQIVTESPAPKEAAPLTDVLNRYSSRK